MSVRIGVVMDPIARIKPYKDTTLAMLLEAQRRGWEIAYLELGDLWLDDGLAHGHQRRLTVHDDNHHWFELGEGRDAPLAELDVILMRKDPPVDYEFVYATHILEAAEREGTLVINRPAALREAQEKLFATHFPQCCAPTLVDMHAERLRAFIRQHGRAVLKPLHGMGGDSVFVLDEGDPNTSVVLETLSERGTRYVMAQRYLPEISAGDKRILVIDGEPVPYALARVPAAGETRGNLAAGGRGEGVELTERDRWIVDEVAPALKARGIWFAGLDVIGEYLTEINLTSPTCVRELDRFYGMNIAGELFDWIEARLPR
ncbi:glutathione synthase [Arhodomonas aquaeolei]|uniref:glutathione synthase n=1 Tax=Arhodomonas aquaeolei TaxID=2369 RepID=UPI0021697038|nr:glutathione synthase [Arhodomonas aquaeolei]MCS4505557.1 glutathione synthase [Arhodomonas aquaeolei]